MRFPILISKSAGCVLLLAAALALSGCSVILENPADGAVAIAREGSELRVVVCTSFTATEVRMSERAQRGSWSYFWTFAKDIDLDIGDDVSPSRAAELGVDPARPPLLDAGDDISIVLSKGPDSVAAQFSIPESGLPDDAWLHPNGDLTDQPCE